MRKFLGKVWRDVYRTLGVKWEQGWQEAQNVVFPASNVAVPGVVSQAQLAHDYESAVRDARGRAGGHEHERDEHER